MGLTQRKRRQVQKHRRTLRQCGECPITLLCYTGRLPAYTTICRCNVCGLIYALDSTGARQPLFKPFRCTATEFPDLRFDRTLPGSTPPAPLVQLMSGMMITAIIACPDCKVKRICIRCGKPASIYDKMPGPEGHYVHYSCTDLYQRFLLQQATQAACSKRVSK